MIANEEQVVNKTFNTLTRISSLLFRDFKDDSKSLVRSVKRSGKSLVQLIKDYRPNALVDHDYLKEISKGYGIEKLELDSQYSSLFNELALKLDLKYSKEEIENGKTRFFVSKKDYKKIKILKNLIDVNLKRRKELDIEDFKEYLYTKEKANFLKIENLNNKEIELLRFNRVDHDLVYAISDNNVMLIAESDYEKFLDSYSDVRAYLEGKDKEVISNSLNNRILARDIVNTLDYEKIKKYKNLLVVDSVSPDKFIDVEKIKDTIIRFKGEITEYDIAELKKSFSYMTAPVVFNTKEYEEFNKLAYKDQEKIIRDKAGFYISDVNVDNKAYDKKSIEKSNLTKKLVITSKSLKKKITKERFDEIINTKEKRLNEEVKVKENKKER